MIDAFRRSNTSDLSLQAAELAGMPLELIMAASLPQALEVRKANPNMPMVIGTCPGFVSNGFAKSLERPGASTLAWMSCLPGDRRRLRLLKIAAPKISRGGLLSTTPGRGGHETQVAEAEKTGRTLRLTVKAYRGDVSE